jgi:ubiquinol-cytochrome c reductase iron-sulfur subunit
MSRPEPGPKPGRQDARDERAERRATLLVGASFVIATVSGLLVMAVYLMGGQTQLEGVLLAATVGGLGVGLVVWSHRLMPVPQRTEERHPLGSGEADRRAVLDAVTHEPGIARRTVLVRLLAGAVAGLAAAFAVPLFSLGPSPGRALFETPWRRGKRLVDAAGRLVTADTVPVDSIATVFPEGDPGSPDGQAVLIHLDPGRIDPAQPMAQWAPQGFVVYSKVCTHAGCPVGLYRQASQQLICPCHQSTFDVLRGAAPISGPAVRPLPQLPIRLQSDGTFEALGDFPEPVGPSFWNRTA